MNHETSDIVCCKPVCTCICPIGNQCSQRRRMCSEKETIQQMANVLPWLRAELMKFTELNQFVRMGNAAWRVACEAAEAIGKCTGCAAARTSATMKTVGNETNLPFEVRRMKYQQCEKCSAFTKDPAISMQHYPGCYSPCGDFGSM